MDKRHLLTVWKNAKGSYTNKIQPVYDEVCRFHNIDLTLPNPSLDKVHKIVEIFCRQLKKLWVESNRNEANLLQKKKIFFDEHFILSDDILEQFPSIPSSTTTKDKVGRPLKSFEESSEVVKRRKTAELRDNFSVNELLFAGQMKCREQGETAKASMIKKVTESPGEFLKPVKTIINGTPYSDDEALALIINAKLTKSQYMEIRIGAKSRNFDNYPTYNKIVEAKKRCYPSADAITVSETSAEINLQSLLDHTASRIIEANKQNIIGFSEEELRNLKMISKWGFDGSTGHSEYKQRYMDTDDHNMIDNSILITSLVPITMEVNGQIIFQNPRPSSTRFCRPIRFQFVKESTDVSKQEHNHVQCQIDELHPTEIAVGEAIIRVEHKLLLTMIDGKVCNAITSTTSAQRCYICGATPTNMNEIDAVREREVDETTFQFGLSTLHAWIRFLEYFLHLSYRLEIEKWQIRAVDSVKVKERKILIQQRFKAETGLIIDKVRPGGAGTSNDGNTARRFFHNYESSADITGIDETVIRRCGNILGVISSGYHIKIFEFDKYCLETARLLVNLYPLFYMPASVHKILIHGSTIIRSAILPIGLMSEEAQEARNKDLKSFRELNTRKTSRKITNVDLLNRLLVSSDPYISTLKKLPINKRSMLSSDAMSLVYLQGDNLDVIDDDSMDESEISGDESTSD